MSLSAYRVARNDMRALRRQTLAKVFRPGMTAIEASHALAMELGYSFTDTTIHSDLKALGLKPESGTERVRAMMTAITDAAMMLSIRCFMRPPYLRLRR